VSDSNQYIYIIVHIICNHPVVLSEPVPITARSKAHTIFGRSNTGIAGSNAAQGMDVCLHFSVLCCPEYVEILHWADLPSKESYQNVQINS
jgi:hypothetical protein